MRKALPSWRATVCSLLPNERAIAPLVNPRSVARTTLLGRGQTGDLPQRSVDGAPGEEDELVVLDRDALGVLGGRQAVHELGPRTHAELAEDASEHSPHRADRQPELVPDELLRMTAHGPAGDRRFGAREPARVPHARRVLVSGHVAAPIGVEARHQRVRPRHQGMPRGERSSRHPPSARTLHAKEARSKGLERRLVPTLDVRGLPVGRRWHRARAADDEPARGRDVGRDHRGSARCAGTRRSGAATFMARRTPRPSGSMALTYTASGISSRCAACAELVLLGQGEPIVAL